ncbi:hypothetical protein [Nocardia miyunensis]|uniref:hypothetical protein n=1 Tax=Nocardia miyunensis TaxID=282684 RepID=UPI00082E9286|nr:hypothetical protein [Nocardia miyunensis]
MVDADIHAAVQLAREVAELIPEPSGSLLEDEASHRLWADVMVNAADNLAFAYRGRAELLEAAVGPALEVGVNPPWRVLLILALARIHGVTSGLPHYLLAVEHGALTSESDRLRVAQGQSAPQGFGMSKRTPLVLARHNCGRKM